MKNENQNDVKSIGGGVLTDGVSLFLEDGAIAYKGGMIVEIGSTKEIKNKFSDFTDVKGRIIMPGFLNAHHHLYSYFAVGLSPLGETDSFVKILENLWWRLDTVLDREAVYYSSLMGLIEAVKNGTTMVFDHHASMKFIKGSLNEVKKGFEKLSLKGLLSFETSNRHGLDSASHIAENLSFFEENKNSKNIKGLMGLHANLTLDENLLKRISKDRPLNIPIHIHLGEDRADLDFCLDLGYEGVLHRLEAFNLLSEKSILAHAIHLSERDFEIIDKINPIIVSNAESNSNNRVGKMSRSKIKEYVLGTDGMSCDMIQTLRSHYLLGKGNKENFKELSQVFFSNKIKVQKKFFPLTGEFKVGNFADITVLDYFPFSEVTKENLIAHLIFGAKNAKAFMSVSNGETIYKEGKIFVLDEDSLRKEASKVAKKLHEKYFS